MKKFATILVLLFVLSVSAFAGEFPITGRSCPQEQQTCFTEGQYPAGGKFENQIIETIFDFIKSIIG